MSPLTLRKSLMDRIANEIEHAKAGRPGAIWAKMNALVDARVIDALYDASAAGCRLTSLCAVFAVCARACRA